jgi:hypothetical protein
VTVMRRNVEHLHVPLRVKALSKRVFRQTRQVVDTALVGSSLPAET